MKASLAVISFGDVSIGQRQAEAFAKGIFSDVRTFVMNHQNEYEAWQKAGEPLE